MNYKDKLRHLWVRSKEKYYQIRIIRNILRLIKDFQHKRIYSKNKKIILIKTESGYQVLPFRKTCSLINKKGVPCIYVYKDEDYKKYYDKASTIFEWGNLSKKLHKKNQIIHYDYKIPKQKQFEIWKKLEIKDFPKYKFTDDLNIVKKLKFPILAKPINGIQCQGIMLIKNKNDLKIIDKNNLKDYIFCEYIKYGDYEYKWRVTFVDDTLLWSYVRIRKQKDYIQPVYSVIKINKIRIIKPPKFILKKLKKISVHLRKNYPSAIIGFDLLSDNKFENFKILECNMNPAYYIVQWLDKKQNCSENLANYLIKEFKKIK